MSPFIERLGWVLIHSLWQFALLAGLAFVLQRALRRATANARYLSLLGTLALAIAAPLVTWSLLPAPAAPPVAVASPMPPAIVPAVEPAPSHAPVAVVPYTPPAVAQSAAPTLPALPPVVSPVLAPVPAISWTEWAQGLLTPWLATIVWGWSLGVLAFAIRPLWSWFTVRRLRTSGVSPVPEAIQALLESTARRLGLRHVVSILQSTVVQVPIVAGYLKPVILLPASIVTGLPASQLEAILAHELAHIRRHDFVVNLLQTLVETVFFYHPGVWWLSHQIRCERENCCDDIAVGVIGNRLDYSRALLALEELRGTQTPLALGASGGSLLSRVRRLFGREPAPPRVPNGSIAIAVLLIVGMLAILSIAQTGQSGDDSKNNDGLKASVGPFIAKLPNGVEIELTGITPNAAPTTQGWRASGTPLGDLPNWPRGATFSRDGGQFHMTTDTETKLTPDPLARDLLFECRGAVSSPSWVVLQPEGLAQFQTLTTEAGFRRRLTPYPKEGVRELTLEMAYTDSPGGPWQRIDTAGKRINTIETFAPDQKLYGDMQIVRLGAVANTSDQGSPLELVLNEPAVGDAYHSGLFAIDVRFVDKNQKVWNTYQQPEPAKNGRRNVRWLTPSVVPLDTLQYAEFRLRPYRHFITFENVPLVKEAAGRVAVKQRSIPEPPRRTPDERFVAHLPAGVELELLGIVRNDLPDEQSWNPNGAKTAGIEWPNRTAIQRMPNGGHMSSVEGPGSDQVWDFAYAFRGNQTRPNISTVVIGGGSAQSSQSFPALGPQVFSLIPTQLDQLTKVQLRVGLEPWGPWIQVGADGVVLNPAAISDAANSPDQLITLAGVGIDENDIDKSWFKWLALPQAYDLYSMEVRAIDDTGDVHLARNGTHDVGARPLSKITQTFNLPMEKIERFEYRLRPYRHLVTFDNICTDTAKPTEVKVTVEPIVYPNEVAVTSEENHQPIREPLVAKLPGGLEVELVGVTKNYASAQDGWKADGSPLNDDSDWPARIIVNKKGVATRNKDDGSSDPTARDLLVEVRGLQSQPAITLLDTEAIHGWPQLPHANPYRNRYSLLRKKPSDTLTFRLAISDAAWGPYQSVSREGATLDSVEPDELDRRHYDAIRVVASTHYEERQCGQLILEVPSEYHKKYALEVRAIDIDGKEHGTVNGSTQDANSPVMTLNFSTWLGLPLERVARWEYRLRSYRHFIKFENVSFEPGKKTEPKVSVESIPVPDKAPDSTTTATLPTGQVLELLGVVPSAARGQDGWTPAGLRLDPVPDWARLLKGEVAPAAAISDVVDDQYRDFVVRVKGLKPEEIAPLGLAGKPVPYGQESWLSRMSVLTYGQSVQRLRLGIPGEWGPYRVGLLDAKNPPKAKVSDTVGEIPAAMRASYDSIQPVIEASPDSIIWGPPQLDLSDVPFNPEAKPEPNPEAESKTRVRVVWKGQHSNPDLKYAIVESVLIDTDGKRHSKAGTTIKVEGEAWWDADIFDVPLEQVSHVEYRLRPYAHVVTFNNIALSVGAACGPNVVVESPLDASQTQSEKPARPRLPVESYGKYGVPRDQLAEADKKRPAGPPMGDVQEPAENERGESPLVLGLRIASDADWRIGGQVKVELTVRNTSAENVLFQHTGRSDNGLSVVAIDQNGQEKHAYFAQFDGLLLMLPKLLPPGHIMTVKGFALRFDSEKQDVSEPSLGTFQLPPGDYTLKCRWNDARPEVAHEGEWTGELTSVDHKFQLGDDGE